MHNKLNSCTKHKVFPSESPPPPTTKNTPKNNNLVIYENIRGQNKTKKQKTKKKQGKKETSTLTSVSDNNYSRPCIFGHQTPKTPMGKPTTRP